MRGVTENTDVDGYVCACVGWGLVPVGKVRSSLVQATTRETRSEEPARANPSSHCVVKLNSGLRAPTVPWWKRAQNHAGLGPRGQSMHAAQVDIGPLRPCWLGLAGGSLSIRSRIRSQRSVILGLVTV